MARGIPWERLAAFPPDDAGLSSAEAVARRTRFGPNEIVLPAHGSWLQLARDTAGDPMIWFLIAVATLYLGMGELAEAATLAVAIVPLVGMDAMLHWRTRASTEGLTSRLGGRPSFIHRIQSQSPGTRVGSATGHLPPPRGSSVASSHP